MQIKAIELGDIFVHENGIRYQVDNIFCAYDEQESRWETSIGYKVIPKSPTVSPLRNVVKARDFVLLIQEQGPVGHNFVAQISGSTGPVTPAAEEISPTPGPAFGSLGNGAVSGGNSSVAVGSGVAAPARQPLMERLFIRNAYRYGLLASDLGKPITLVYNSRVKKFTIAGAKPANHKYPILIRRTRDGKIFKETAERVKSALA